MTHRRRAHTASERYLLEEMPELERYAFEEHFFSCADCAEDVRAGALMHAASARDCRPAVSTPLPVRRPRRRQASRGGHLLPWAAAASLALAVGYQQFARARQRPRSSLRRCRRLRFDPPAAGVILLFGVGGGGFATFALMQTSTAVRGRTDVCSPQRCRRTGGFRATTGAGGGNASAVAGARLDVELNRPLCSVGRDATSPESAASEYAFVVTTP